MRRKQVTKALIAAGIQVEDVISAFDEIDKNRDNLVTYEELRFYVKTSLGEDNVDHLITIDNFNLALSSSDAKRLNVWRSLWHQIAQSDDDKVSKEAVLEILEENCDEPLSPEIKQALHY